MIKQRKNLIALGIALVLLVPAGAFAAINGSRFIGYSATSMARGGTDIAVADDSSGIQTNPAGMSRVDGTVVDMNMYFLFPQVSLANDLNPDEAVSQDRFLLAPGMGFVHHLKDSKWSFGLSVAAPDALATDYTVNANYFNANPMAAGTASSQSAFSEWIHLRMAPAVSYEVSDRLSLGFRAGLEYMTLDLATPLGRSFVNLGTADGFGYSLGAGVQYRPISNLTLGLSVESQAYMQDLTSRRNDASLALDVSGLDLGAGVNPDGTILSFSNMKTTISDWEAPPIVGTGAAWQVSDKLSLMADFKYFFWSKTNDHMTVSFSGEGADTLTAMTGLDTLTIPMNWQDSWGASLGGSYMLKDCLVGHLGYNYGEMIVEQNYANYLTPITLEHHLTAGATFVFDPLEVTLAGVYSFSNTESNGNLSGIDDSVTAQLGGIPLDSELNNADVEGEILSFALQFSYKF